MKREKSLPFPFHMLFTAALPVLALYALNVHSTPSSALVLPLLAVLLAALSVWALIAALTRNTLKAGFIVSLGLVVFFGYGLLWEATTSMAVEGFDFQREEYPLAFAAVLFVVGSSVILLMPGAAALTRIANVGSLLLVLASAACVFYRVRTEETPRRHLEAVPVSSDMLTPPSTLPDIYYVVLEGYSRADTIKDVYGEDTSEFVAGLKAQGFYVAEESTSNYAEAAHHLASSLNLTYLDSIASSKNDTTLPPWVPAKFRGQADFSVVTENLQENYLFPLLRRMGYEIVGLPTGWTPTEQVPADLRLRGPSSWSEFQIALLNMTPLRPFLGMAPQFDPMEDHRERVDYVFDALPKLAEHSGSASPKFIFAHVRCPRFPFAFNERGGRQPAPQRGFSWSSGNMFFGSSDGDTAPGYLSQIRYINERVQEVVSEIISRSENPPIIVVQGGHGPSVECGPETRTPARFKERFPILNAFYLPENGGAMLHPGISPVNTFRVVLNEYFGAELKLLDDRNYCSKPETPLLFEDVTEQVQPVVGAETPAKTQEGSES